jgi:hypothetical protein
MIRAMCPMTKAKSWEEWKNATYYNVDVLQYSTLLHPGEKCQLFDPKGKVIASVHEGYKGQVCAIHYLDKKMPMK